MENRICYGCMTPMHSDGAICSKCSYNNNLQNPIDCLPCGTILGGNYLIGRVISQNDLTITYLALQKKNNVRVYIEEYFPKPIARRGFDGFTVFAQEQDNIKYKTLYSDIADRWKRLKEIDSRCMRTIKELFAENSTLYCVTSYSAYQTLEQFLEENGPIGWAQAKASFMPIFSFVSNLHARGLTHCGISPQNILVSRRGQLILSGFSLPELRTLGSCLTPELYSGYSAPEQYSKNLWQGEWTDIYSLAAVLYKTLTGVTPNAATDRTPRDPLKVAAFYNDTIPDNVSTAIKLAMQPEKAKRYKTIDEFTAALLQQASSNTAVFSPDPISLDKKAHNSTRTDKPKSALEQFLSNKIAIIFLILLVISVFINMIVLANAKTMLPPEESQPESVVSEPALMEYSFVGMYIKTVESHKDHYQGVTLEISYDYNENYPADIIYEQSVAVGQEIPADSIIKINVSRGSQYVTVPYLIGSSVNFASKTLTDLGISYDFIDDYNPESPGIVGTVTAMNKGFGSKVSKETDHIVLTIKREPTYEITG